MISENWEIKIESRPGYINYAVHVFRKTAPKTVEVLYGNELVVHDLNKGEEIKPTLYMTEEMLQAFADALSSRGYNPQKGFFEGKIEATEKHLEDMRKLVFKTK